MPSRGAEEEKTPAMGWKGGAFPLSFYIFNGVPALACNHPCASGASPPESGGEFLKAPLLG